VDYNQKQEQLFKFLDKNYIIENSRFVRKCDSVHEWGKYIASSLCKIFSFDHEVCTTNFWNWSEQRGMTKTEWDLAYNKHELKTQWSVEMAHDLEALHGVSSGELQVITMLANELAKEIDAEILKELKSKTKTMDEFISLVKCFGYEPTPTLYDNRTLKPKKGFVSMKYNDVKNEQQSNHIWQNHFRPTRVDQ